MNADVKILALETSYSICSVALLKDGKKSGFRGEGSFQHAETLTGLIETCLKETDTDLSEIDAIAISDGPGSYTGLRIGSSTAKGLCFTLNKPLIPVPTLRALASACFDRSKDHQGMVWPMIDARRMEVYDAIFDSEMHVIKETGNGIVTEPGFCPEYVFSENTLICGDGGKKAAEFLDLPYADILQDAVHLLGPAEHLYFEKGFADLDSYQPFYLKQANITASKK